MAEVIEAYEEENADSRKMDTLTEDFSLHNNSI